MNRPEDITSGGMGIGISNPFLAQAVSKLGGYGTVSGVASEWILFYILQAGDPGGHYRRALAHFPFPSAAAQVLEAYFVEGGIFDGAEQKRPPKFTLEPKELLINLTICANFALVWLAKEGHSNPVGINYLDKIGMSQIYSFVGAMLAGVDRIVMGAGIPLHVPGILDSLAQNQRAEYRAEIVGGGFQTMTFDLQSHFGQAAPLLHRPDFWLIVSSYVLAKYFLKKASGKVQGFIIEHYTAGGHNAPPYGSHGQMILNEWGEPIYDSVKDEPDYSKIAALGLNFLIAGGMASPEKLAWAKERGAIGIQVGSIFALSRESGLRPDLAREIRSLGYLGHLVVRRNPQASPSGYPFMVVSLPGTLSELSVRENWKHRCDYGCLSKPNLSGSGHIYYSCPAAVAGDHNVCCLCKGLLAAAGFVDVPPIVTLGSNFDFLGSLMQEEGDEYGVADVMAYLLI